MWRGQNWPSYRKPAQNGASLLQSIDWLKRTICPLSMCSRYEPSTYQATRRTWFYFREAPKRINRIAKLYSHFSVARWTKNLICRWDFIQVLYGLSIGRGRSWVELPERRCSYERKFSYIFWKISIKTWFFKLNWVLIRLRTNSI